MTANTPADATVLVRALHEMQNDASPYIVRSSGDTVTIKLNLADATWLNVLAAHHLERVFKINVSLNENKHQAKVEASDYEVQWDASAGGRGVHVGGKIKRFRGTKLERGREIQIGYSPERGLGRQVDYRFDSVSMTRDVKKIIRAHGWSVGQPASTIGAALVAGVAAIGTVIGLLSELFTK